MGNTINATENEGFMILERNQVKILMEQDGLSGCYRKDAHNVWHLIPHVYDADEIERFMKNGGQIGVKYMSKVIPDNDMAVQVPEKIVISDITFFDDMEDSLWKTVLGYFCLLGIKFNSEEAEENPDFYPVKEMQDMLLSIIEKHLGTKIFYCR